VVDLDDTGARVSVGILAALGIPRQETGRLAVSAVE
jgi:hypothetical protein